MAKNNPKLLKSVSITSLEQIASMKDEMRQEIDASEERLGGIWEEMFHKPTAEELASPTRKVISWVNASAGMIDGLMLGWKLYRRFSQGRQFFRKKK